MKDLTGWRMTHHATARVEEMGLSAVNVAEALAFPAMEYHGGDAHPQDGRRTVVGQNDVVVVVNPLKKLVITVLYHRAEGREQEVRR